MFLLPLARCVRVLFFFFTDTATTDIYTLSLHDALPISRRSAAGHHHARQRFRESQRGVLLPRGGCESGPLRSEEHTSELQSRRDLVCRLLLEKKNKT